MKVRLSVLLLVSLLSFSCNKNSGTPAQEKFDVDFVLPVSLELSPETREFTFTVIDGKAPLLTDVFMLTGQNGVSVPCEITNVSTVNFTVYFNVAEGEYTVSVKRGNEKKVIGNTLIRFVEDLDFTPDAGSSIYGIVSCEGKGVPNVVVSDGIEVVLTDEQGIYQMKSGKKWASVFISVPSGYEVPSVGILPQFYSRLVKPQDELERVDFTLSKTDQSSYSMLFFGDMHMANKSTDRLQFKDFAADINSYIGSHPDKKIYAATLGDMTWDIYWYSSKYDFVNYLEEMNSQITGLQVFHTMGNHDNDYLALTDLDAAKYYVSKIAPTYYSFNIGDVHYVVLDDINCSRYDGTTARDYYTDVTVEQISWLVKDLSFVDRGRPVVLLAHAQMYSTSGFGYKKSLANLDELLAVLDGYEVHFVTGHTHRVYNITPEDAVVNGRNIHEHNSGAVCATWWHTGDVTPGIHISTDGAPGGYAVWDISGTDIEWRFKATGWQDSYQFRAYDLNNVSFSFEDVPNMPPQFDKNFQKYVDAYPVNSNNEVLINVWNWNSGWEVSVSDETGKTLDVTRVQAYDPLHIKALAIPRYNNSSLTSAPMFMASYAAHFFKVQADNKDVDLIISVKDEFGNVWTETMQRPKAFSIAEYKCR